MIIRVIDYNKNWPRMYEEEAEKLKELLKNNLIGIYHIGSTSVVGMKAKPVIDIMLVVKDLEKLDDRKRGLELLGYEVMGEYGIKGRRYYRKGGDYRTHQIHAFEYRDLNNICRHLFLRDYLIENPYVAAEYGDLKARLAREFPEDIVAYSEAKAKFVDRLEGEAIKLKFKNVY